MITTILKERNLNSVFLGQLMKVINVSGSTNSGKSTLTGYLLYKYSVEKYYIDLKTRYFQMMMKTNKVPVSEYLANLIQVSTDETLRQMTMISKAVRLKTDKDNLVFIDVGGHNKYTFQVHLSSVESDTTLFTVGVDEVKERAYIRETFLTHFITSYITRKSFSKTPVFHLVLTKVDTEPNYDKYFEQLKEDINVITKNLGMTDVVLFYYTSGIKINSINNIISIGDHETLVKNLLKTERNIINEKGTVFHVRDLMYPERNVRVLGGRLMTGRIEKKQYINTQFGELQVKELEIFGNKVNVINQGDYAGIRFENDEITENFRGGEILGNYRLTKQLNIRRFVDLQDNIKNIINELGLPITSQHFTFVKYKEGSSFYTTINGFRNKMKINTLEKNMFAVEVEKENSLFLNTPNTGIVYNNENKLIGAFII